MPHVQAGPGGACAGLAAQVASSQAPPAGHGVRECAPTSRSPSGPASTSHVRSPKTGPGTSGGSLTAAACPPRPGAERGPAGHAVRRGHGARRAGAAAGAAGTGAGATAGRATTSTSTVRDGAWRFMTLWCSSRGAGGKVR